MMIELAVPRFRWTCLPIALCLVSAVLLAQVNVTTYHNDNARTGQNTAETVLTPSNVNSGQFGRLFTATVDGYVYAQPLYLANVQNIANGTHNVIYAATEHDSLYAIDADNGTVLWQQSFINPTAGITTVSSNDVACSDLVPEIGISSTPVIDTSTGTIYLVTKTKENGSFFQRLHALDVATHAEKFGGPVVISATFNGTAFDPLKEHNRPGLLLENGHVVIAWASHCDNGPYQGWVMSYNAGTLAREAVFSTEADPTNGFFGGIWMSGDGVAADSSGNLFFATGNGDYNDTKGDYGDSIMKLGGPSGGAFNVVDWFTPFNQGSLSNSDSDVGSGGLLLLPDLPTNFSHRHLLVQMGKEGKIYLVDRDNMGKFCSTCNSQDTQIVQEIPGATTGIWGSPSYWNGSVYWGAGRDGGSSDFLKAYSFNANNSGLLSASPTSESTNTFDFATAAPVVSANGTANGIVWILDNGSFNSTCCQALYAYDATNLATMLYNSNQAANKRDAPGGAVKFSAPIIANGKVYVGSRGTVSGFGLLGIVVQVSPPSEILSQSGSQTFTATVTGTPNTAVTWSISPQVGTLTPNGLSASYTAPAVITTSQVVILTATSVADTTKSAYATITLVPPGSAMALVNAGGSTYTDTQNQIWAADTNFTGGQTASTTSTISNTADPTLYRTERYGSCNYTFNVPNGNYSVTLKFAEFYFTTKGQRVFNVAINGTTVLSNFDIIATAGAALTALDETFAVPVTNGNGITIQFILGSADLPKISAIAINQASGGVFVQVSPTSATLQQSGSQTFTATVTGTPNTAVTWSISPQVGTLTPNGLSASYTAPAVITTSQVVILTATSVADTTKSASAKITLVPPGNFSPIFVNSGGSAYTDTQSHLWVADKNFSGGQAASTTHAISNTPDPALYQTERYGASTYTFSVPNGNYNVTLKFAETYWTSKGQRLFNVAINGTPVLANFDILAAAGGAYIALDKTFSVPVTNSGITIQFGLGSADLPRIDAISITQGSGVFVQVSPPSANLQQSGSQIFNATVTGTPNTAVTWSISPQVGTLTPNGQSAQYTAPSSITNSQVVTITATSVADTTQSGSAQITLLPPWSPTFVNAGGPAYTDTQSHVWVADKFFSGGNTANTTHAITNTPDPTLYKTERYGASTYTFNVPSGNYNVTLKFAEFYWTANGKRIFNVTINGTQVLSSFDIVAAAGGPYIALDKTFPVTVTNNGITIQFTLGSADLPKISAIAIQ